MAPGAPSHIIGLPGGESITSKTSPYRLLLAPLLIPMCEFDYRWTPTVRAFKHQIPYRRQTLKERHNPRHKQRSTRSRGLCSHRLKTPQKERIIYADTCCPCLVLQKSGSQANSTFLPPPKTGTKQQHEKRSALKTPGKAPKC